MALLAVLAYCAFDLLLPLIRVPHVRLSTPTAVTLIIVPTAVFMLLQLWFSRAVVGLNPRPALCILLMVLSVGLWFGLLSIRGLPHSIAEALLRSLGSNLAITFACTFLGILLSRIVREANILLPVALIAMPIDYLGAMTTIGFTHDVVTKHPKIVQHVSISVPTIGGLHPLSFIGPGDALFMAFFFAVVLRLNMNDRGTFWWMYGLLTIAMLIVLFFPINVAALVPMGLAVLIANVRFFRLKRDEAFAVLYASLLVLVLVVGFYLYSHSHFFRH
jgi:hypothetical protein